MKVLNILKTYARTGFTRTTKLICVIYESCPFFISTKVVEFGNRFVCGEFIFVRHLYKFFNLNIIMLIVFLRGLLAKSKLQAYVVAAWQPYKGI